MIDLALLCVSLYVSYVKGKKEKRNQKSELSEGFLMVVREFITAPQALILAPFCAKKYIFFLFLKNIFTNCNLSSGETSVFFFCFSSFLFVFPSAVDFLAQD